MLTHRLALQLQAEQQDFGLVSLGQSGTLPETARLTFQQLRPAMLSAGLITEADAAAMEEALDDPAFVHIPGGIMSAWGRRPQVTDH